MFFTLFFPSGTLVKFNLSNGEVSNDFYLVFPHNTLVKLKLSKGEVSSALCEGATCDAVLCLVCNVMLLFAMLYLCRLFIIDM